MQKWPAKKAHRLKKLLSSHNNKPFIVWWTTYLFYLWGREGGCWWWSLAEIMVLWVGFVVLLPWRAGCEQGMVVKTASNCLPSIIIVWESGPSTPFPIYLCIWLSRHPTYWILLVPINSKNFISLDCSFHLKAQSKMDYLFIFPLYWPYIALCFDWKKPATQAYL